MHIIGEFLKKKSLKNKKGLPKDCHEKNVYLMCLLEINVVYELFNFLKKTSIKQEYYLIYIFI